jgi:hypothetical protein
VSNFFFADDASLLPWKFIPIHAHKIHILHGCNKQENGDKHEEFFLGVQRILSEWKAKGSFCLCTRGLLFNPLLILSFVCSFRGSGSSKESLQGSSLSMCSNNFGFFFVKSSMFLLFSVSLILHEMSNLALPEILKFHHSMNNAHNLVLKSVKSLSSVSLCCLEISEKSD